MKNYTGINLPVLALVAVPQHPSKQSGDQLSKDAQLRADAQRLNEILLEFIHRWETNLKRADPATRIAELPGAHHYLFLSEEENVLREVQLFQKTLQ